MTNYWWMHWFWITCLFYVVSSQTLLTTLHSMAPTDIPLDKRNRTLHITTTETTEFPSSNLSPLVSKNASLLRKNSTSFKYTKPFKKKLDLLLPNSTLKVNSSKRPSINRDISVITQENVTEAGMFVNITDSETVVNTSMNPLNHTDNLTYLNEEPSCNQSLIQNAGIIGIEEQEPESTSGNLSAAGITGITLGCVILVGIICGVSFFLYHNRGFNRPQVLNDRCSNPDSSGYIDDASVRDNSEEMYSLDNDSFLNSLEAMTIQNYWTDTVKHTKL